MNKSTENTEDFICEQLNHKIKILENIIENFENLPSQYKYLWDKDIEDMTVHQFISNMVYNIKVSGHPRIYLEAIALMQGTDIDTIIATYTPEESIQEFYNGFAYQQQISTIISQWKPDLIFAYTINALTAYNYYQHKIPYVISSVDLDASMLRFKYQYRNHQGRKHQIRLYLKQLRAQKLDTILIDYCKDSLS